MIAIDDGPGVLVQALLVEREAQAEDELRLGDDRCQLLALEMRVAVDRARGTSGGRTLGDGGGDRRVLAGAGRGQQAGRREEAHLHRCLQRLAVRHGRGRRPPARHHAGDAREVWQ